MTRTLTALMALVLFVGCGRPDATRETVVQALAIADEYVVGYYDQFPKDAYETGYPAPLDRMGDHSPAATAAWEARIEKTLGEPGFDSGHHCQSD